MKYRPFIYPALIALVPILDMYANNIAEVKFADVARSMIVVILITYLIHAAVQWWMRQWDKSALLTAGLVFILMSYGAIYSSLENYGLARHRILIPLFGAGLGLLVWYLRKKTAGIQPLETFAAWFGVFLLITPLYTIVSYHVTHLFDSRAAAPEESSFTPTAAAGPQPDVYYIILDGYGREDTLKEYYSFDNSDFIKQLKDLGFYVAERSTSNYPKTIFSIASSLNMHYLDESILPVHPDSRDTSKLFDLIHHSRAREIMAGLGYRMVNVETGFATSVEDADVYYPFQGRPLIQGNSSLAMNAFEDMLFGRTAAMILLDFGIIPEKQILKGQEKHYLEHQNRILYEFEKLAEIPDLEGDYFVFIHILAPHPPFVFDADGRFLQPSYYYTLSDGSDFLGTEEEYIKGYADQATYINKRVLDAIRTILRKSDVPPIILLQGDHGPRIHVDWESAENSNIADAFSILNAYYLGGKEPRGLYPTITPVNSFRVVFNEQWGMEFDLLPDKSYFTTKSHPYRYIDVTSRTKK